MFLNISFKKTIIRVLIFRAGCYLGTLLRRQICVFDGKPTRNIQTLILTLRPPKSRCRSRKWAFFTVCLTILLNSIMIYSSSIIIISETIIYEIRLYVTFHYFAYHWQELCAWVEVFKSKWLPFTQNDLLPPQPSLSAKEIFQMHP